VEETEDYDNLLYFGAEHSQGIVLLVVRFDYFQGQEW
jgi:hypothetical protein